MATNPWSASLGSTPGYATGAKAVTTPAPTFTAPSIPTVPAIDDARAPNAVGRSWIATQLGNLPGKYNPLIDAARADARYRLAGYGGVTINDNNTTTFDPNAPLGQREKQAVTGAKNQANAQGLLYSSFANKAIGGVLTQLSEDKRNIAMQFASNVNNILMQESSETASLVGDWVKLFGQDSQWLVDHPPPSPVDAPGHTAEDSIAYRQAQIDQHPGNPDAPITPQTPLVAKMTYSDFLHGRKSTRELARQWNRDYNYSRNTNLL